MSEYSPFNKDLRNLNVDDLSALRDASEGWYIEYKREAPNASTIAKSISAFANTYGGWFFLGITEKSKAESVAGGFPGIHRLEIDATLQRIRQAVAGHLAPSPHFDARAIWGPCTAIGLGEDQAVICVHVPQSRSAPHIHKSGQIYRRVADGSEPKAENDRFVLDSLWRRGDGVRERYKTWIDKDPELSDAEDEKPYVRLLMVSDLWRDRDAWADVTLEEVRNIFGKGTSLISAIPFDNIYTCANGFVARQLANNDPFDLGLTWYFRQNLVSEIIIPLTVYKLDGTGDIEAALDGYDGAASFARILKETNLRSPRIVDLNLLFNLLMGVIEIQKRLEAKARWTDGFHVKARLLNVWRTIPFLDVSSVLSEFEKHGPPMCLEETVTSPSGIDPETFEAVLADFPGIETDVAKIIMRAIVMFGPIAQAFGIPRWIENGSGDAGREYHMLLQEAGLRAIKVQNLRTEQERRRRRLQPSPR